LFAESWLTLLLVWRWYLQLEALWLDEVAKLKEGRLLQLKEGDQVELVELAKLGRQVSCFILLSYLAESSFYGP